MSKCLVVGANGFIGSHLVDCLLKLGHEVRAFDRFSEGTSRWSTAGAERFQGDFLNRSDLSKAMEGQEYVFHFLSMTSPATAEEDPTLDVRTNVAQSIELLEIAATNHVRRVYFASTGGAIYGDQGRTLYSETDLTLPISPYGIGKLTVENYLRYFRLKRNLESVSLRISNPYGPRQHDNRKQGLIPIVLRQLSLGLPVTRFGDGEMVRDYIFVEDLAEMICGTVGKSMTYDTYNLGSGRGSSVNEVLATIKKVTNIDFAVREEVSPLTYVRHVILSTDRFSSEFTTPLLKSLEVGVRQTYQALLDTP